MKCISDNLATYALILACLLFVTGLSILAAKELIRSEKSVAFEKALFFIASLLSLIGILGLILEVYNPELSNTIFNSLGL